MVPTASPGESSYRINATWDPVSNQPVVASEYQQDPVDKQIYYSAIYRENSYSQTYVTDVALSTTDTISVNGVNRPSIASITVADPYKLVTPVNYLNTVTPFNGVNYYCDLADIDILQVSDVYVTNNAGNEVNPDLYYWIAGTNANSIKIVFLTDPNLGDPVKQVSVRVAIGNTLTIEGEQIKFASINLNWNTSDYGKISQKELDILWDGLPLWETIIETPYIKSFVGKEDPEYPPPCVSDIGSSILLQITPTKYIYIGVGILELKFREKVQEFVTETGCRNTVDSWIYTAKNAIDPLVGIKYPLSLLKKNGVLRHPDDISEEEYKKYKDNKVDIKFLHNFVL
jgi:hypothetical protein